MLDPERAVRDHPVEDVTIEVAGDRLVIADGPDPVPAGWAAAAAVRAARQGAAVANRGRADLDRPAAAATDART